ncbi:DUF1343 domain-containing protein [Paenibacillus hemerocallicola]|uniref:DUF1343 domain-containing protein n=1 Tax=Paenibacillus hemerocallicola TaxID=1172614 RepID=A0A5C4TDC8_9BACL|nr:DUF1343 domain-containing protein [Paenibacillus hemerocallicola]TNJ66626.1 DUF1343 domain-containing protein [Paenibacillus hemerocallicola]
MGNQVWASPNVRTGADQLNEAAKTVFAGARVGLVTCAAAINSRFQSTVDGCAEMKDAQLAALFACEHGIRGERQAGVLFGDETDPRLGIPVFSLYGETKKPTEAMLEHVDVVLFDIQDIGVRFFTYLATLAYVMEACALSGKTLIILDRPNPFGGFCCEGGKLVPCFESFVGIAPIPFRTGMTIGEFAVYMNDRLERKCDLKVVRLQGWRRSMEFDETGLPWVMTSPNTPTLDSCRVYPGTCMFEGTNLSEGRGTTRPFEMIGAPWMDGELLAREMNGLRLPGVHFQPVYFTPAFSKHQGQFCSGVQLYVTDKRTFRSVETGLRLVHLASKLAPDRFEWIPPFKEGRKHFIDYLTGSDLVRTKVRDAVETERIVELWSKDADDWRREREPFLLYD